MMRSAFDKELEAVVAWVEQEGGGFFSGNEACERLGVSTGHLAELMENGELDFKKLETLVIISGRSLERIARIRATAGRKGGKRQRSPRLSQRGAGELLAEVIEKVARAKPRASVASIHQEIAARCALVGIPAPPYNTVRDRIVALRSQRA